MTKTIKKLTALLFSATVLILLGGCSSTEIIDSPQEPAKKGKTITLSLSAPENASTRADADHQLRYVAKLVEGNLAGQSIEVKERKESIVSNNDDTTITFVVEEGDYTIILFADYVPSSSTKDDDNCYPDSYYDTHINDLPQKVSINKFELNNDNLDCFGTVIKVTKGEEEVVENVSLFRLVSKIRFISTTQLADNQEIDNISYSRISYHKTINIESASQNSGKGAGIEGIDTQYTATESSNFLNPSNSGNELFFYYTFANKSGDKACLGQVDFSINFKDGTKRDRSIVTGVIPAKRNSITTVQSDFLSPEKKATGNIILNLSTPNNWEDNVSTDGKASWEK